MPQSALGLLIPEAEPLVAPFRRLYDTSAAQGVPAHITILYPFIPPEDSTPEARDGLRSHFAQFSPFTIALTEPRRFTNILYLAPEPSDPIKNLIRQTVRRYPEFLPYNGTIPVDEIIPHLTVAEAADPLHLEEIEAEFRKAARGRLPIRVAVDQVVLIDNTDGRWETRTAFPLGRG
jgi:2'-5' RNA ligase